MTETSLQHCLNMKRIPFKRGDIFTHAGKRYEYVQRWKNNVGAPVYVVKDLAKNQEFYWNVPHLKAAVASGDATKV